MFMVDNVIIVVVNLKQAPSPTKEYRVIKAFIFQNQQYHKMT